MRTRDLHKEENIKTIALQMIVDEGFKGLSMQKLAKKANVSPATIYLYFEDREDLLNKLYLEVLNRTNEAALANFKPTLSFKNGLKTLWLNRFKYYTKHPVDFYFIEQFINSPLIHKVAEKEDESYGALMQEFYKNAVKNKEIAELPIEVYWPVAFAPLYQLIKFSLQKSFHPKPAIQVNEATILQALNLVLKALSA
jgi:AcrR family transcriptional regulator